MSKYVLINVQGIHDVRTKVYDSDLKLWDDLTEILEDQDEYTPDDLLPNGKVCLDYQSITVLCIEG